MKGLACIGLALAIATSAVASTAAARGGPDAGLASCPAGSKPGVIAGNFKCLRVGQRCKVKYQAGYKKYGFVCIAGHLRKRRPAAPPPPPEPPPAPPPAPTPAAIDGHYKGVTSQSESFEFDIFNRGLGFRGLKTGQINEGCTPPFHIYGNYFDSPDYVVPVTVAGDFTIDTPLTGSVGGWPSSGRLTIRGHMAGGAGTGSLELSTTFRDGSNGVTYSCGSGLQTWTVSRTG